MPFHQHFNKGDPIEVLKTHPFTIWLPATLLRSTPTRNNQFYVEFNNLKEPYGSLREYVNACDVRPTPPQELHKYFKVGDSVELLYQEKGWRKGKVYDILENSMYLVSILDDGVRTQEIVKVEQWGLRVFRDWDDGSWIPPLELPQKNVPEGELKSRGVKLRIKCSRCWKETFSEGMSVEVKLDKKGCYGSWHTAVIVKSVGYDKFLVEYQKRKTVNGSQFLKEEIDASCIRPCPPEIQSFHPFEYLDRVDAWFNDGWWEAHIIQVLGGLNYVVCLLTTEEELVFEHSMLRPHQEWVKGKWVTNREFDMTRSSSDMTLKSKELKIRIKCSGRTLEPEPKFSKGMRVEVKSDEEGYQGSWYTAVIVDSIGQHKFLVEYLTLRTEDESELLKEKADASDIRPCPPLIQRIDRFKMLEEVDAWYNEGWWVGLICKILDGLKYMVYFWTTDEELVFDHFTLRPHQDWIDGKWVVAFMKKPQIQVKPKLKGQNGGVARHKIFCIGAKVEVKSDEEGYQGSWYPATIVIPLGNEKYLIRYQTLETDDGTDLLTEEADALSIRPYPPLIQHPDQFRPLDEVDAWYNGGWWAGQVCKVLKGSNYTVYFPISNEMLEFQHSDLRPHQNWLDGEWIAAKRGRIS